MTSPIPTERLEEITNKPPFHVCGSCGYFGPDGPHHPGCNYMTIDVYDIYRALARELLAAREALEDQACTLDFLADKMDKWASDSRNGGWSTHQVNANTATADDCRHEAARVRALLPSPPAREARMKPTTHEIEVLEMLDGRRPVEWGAWFWACLESLQAAGFCTRGASPCITPAGRAALEAQHD